MKKYYLALLLVLTCVLGVGCGEAEVDVHSEIMENLGGIATVSVSGWLEWQDDGGGYDTLTDDQRSQYWDTWIRMPGYLVYEKGDSSGRLYPSKRDAEEDRINTYVYVYFDEDYLPETGGQVVVIGEAAYDMLRNAQIVDNIESTPKAQAEIVDMYEASFDDMSIKYNHIVYDTGRVVDDVSFGLQSDYDKFDLGNRIAAVIVFLEQRNVLNYTILVSSNDASDEGFVLGSVDVENGRIVSYWGIPDGVLDTAESDEVVEEFEKISEQWQEPVTRYISE